MDYLCRPSVCLFQGEERGRERESEREVFAVEGREGGFYGSVKLIDVGVCVQQTCFMRRCAVCPS